MQCTRSVGESLKTPLRDRRRVGRWRNPFEEPRARLRDSCTWQLRRFLRIRLQYPHFDGMVALGAGTSRVHSRFIDLVQAVGQILESRSSVENTAYVFRLCGLTSCIMRKGRASSRQPVWREPSSPGRSHIPRWGRFYGRSGDLPLCVLRIVNVLQRERSQFILWTCSSTAAR